MSGTRCRPALEKSLTPESGQWSENEKSAWSSDESHFPQNIFKTPQHHLRLDDAPNDSLQKVFAESLAKATGIQLYTLGKELNEHLDGTLAAIAAMGCRSVESAGMAGKTAAEFRKALDTAGFKMSQFPSVYETRPGCSKISGRDEDTGA